MTTDHLRAVFIGETSLVVNCAAKWRELGHLVLSVVSDIESIRRGAGERDLPVQTFRQFTEGESEFDFLFSVVNSRILPDSVLSRAREGAINFHDSPLPKYAGVNATNWAIMNREAEHGISWHVMVEEIDAGPILEQRLFAIERDDTALTLNARCYEQALGAFVDLAGSLGSGTAQATAQDLKKRSYFGQWMRPWAAGTIDFRRPAAEIDALVRALDYGPYLNELGRAKINLGDKVQIVHSASVAVGRPDAVPGTVLEASDSSLIVACLDGAVEIRPSAGPPDTQRSAVEGLHIGDYSAGDRLPALGDDNSAIITETASRMARHEKFWIRRLASVEFLDPPYAGLETSAAPGVRAANASAVVTTPPNFHLEKAVRAERLDRLMAAIAVYLSRLGRQPLFDVYFRGTAQCVPEPATPYFADLVPFRIEINADDDMAGVSDYIAAERAKIDRRATFAIDLPHRSPELSGELRPYPQLVVECVGARSSRPSTGTALSVQLEADGSAATWIADTSLISTNDLHRIADQFACLLDDAASRPTTRVAELNLLATTERQLLVEKWNPVGQGRQPSDVITRWRDRVEHSPNQTAVVGPEGAASYAVLDARSDSAAHRLVDVGLVPGSKVGLLLQRSIDMTVVLLASMKAGLTYVPLDASYPAERLRHMLVDSGAALIVTDGLIDTDDLAPLRHFVDTVITVDELCEAPDSSGMLPTLSPEDPAYMIYTSGSTGTPKGVVVPHGALVNHADGVIPVYELDGDDRVLQFAALSFDVAAEELFPTWLAGGTVVLRSAEVLNSFDALEHFVHDHKITVLNLPAAYWSAWVEHLGRQPEVRLPPTIRLVVTGSEKVSTSDLRKWQALTCSSTRWLNAYGPTEATITASVYEPTEVDLPSGPTVPIGQPLANVTLRVLDAGGQLVPIGIPGELYIGGSGLALGYHQRPKLTAERFVADPLADNPTARLYRTGDMARWLHDGTVEFLGRIDEQVKVRGFRIELGEIEAALCDEAAVTQAAVVVRTDPAGNEQLFAFVTGSEGQAKPAELQRALGARLPPYMIPAAIEVLDALPMTPGGKVDRRALPQVVLRPTRAGAKPRTALERELVTIWSEILGQTDIGVDDNFFDLGGTSLSAIRLFSTLQARTGRRVQLPELFAAPTVAALARLVDDDAASSSTPTGDAIDGDGDVWPPWVVAVKSSGSRPPLFHLGGASVLRNLARRLPDEQPLYALLEQDLGADHFLTSVETIVPHCIRGLRAVQPRGPYFIAGLCFGGIVALEMSRQLQAEGEQVSLTVMIDSFAPGALGSVDVQQPPADGDATRSLGTHGLGRLRDPSRLVRKTRRHMWRKAWGPLHETYRRLGIPMPNWLRNVEEANTIASDRYEARPYDGDVILIKASGNNETLDGGPTNGWDGLILGKLEVRETVGGHVSMYQEPHVIGLAAELNRSIEVALTGSRSRRE